MNEKKDNVAFQLLSKEPLTQDEIKQVEQVLKILIDKRKKEEKAKD